MASPWTGKIFSLKTGTPQDEVLVPATGDWTSTLSGRGTGTHTLKLHGIGISRSRIRELMTGNRFVFTQLWGSHVAYAGVIQKVRYNRKTKTLTIWSKELRSAYMNDRMLFGVFSYSADADALVISGKSRSGATRAVLNAAIYDDASYWELPVVLPSDGDGTYSATWKKRERLKLEDHLSQIEASGCEIFFRPYIVSGGEFDGYLRWATHVESSITIGSVTELQSEGDDRLADIDVTIDYAREMTGVLGFGKDGSFHGYSPGDGAAEISVRDTWVNFPDLDGARLVDAVESMNFLGYPVEQWSIPLHLTTSGPAFAAPGRMFDIEISGDPFIPDGTHSKRVIALRGGVGLQVTAEVQDV